MRSTFLLSVAALATLAVAAPASAVPNLVKNGSFENVTGITRSSEFGASYKTGQAVTDWFSPSSKAFNVVFFPGEANGPKDADTRFAPSHPGGEPGQYLHRSTLSPDGGKFVALDGDTNANGPLQQSISGLTANKKYNLGFYWAAAQYADRKGATTERFDVSLGNQTFSTKTLNNASMGFTGWMKQNFTFTATGGTELLSFLSTGTPNGLPPVALLDGVSLQAVPEPAALTVFGLGLIGLGVARLRRR